MKIFHFCMPSPTGNFGDDILFQATKDAFEQIYYGQDIEWVNFPLRYHTTDSVIQKANECDMIVVGGGGLLLKDTVQSSYSGFQWNISVDHLKKIQKPLVIYSIGYNRFYNQEDFDDVFYDTMEVILDKAAFFSVRNTGSKQALISSFPKHKDKIVMNPCPSIFYQVNTLVATSNTIGINLAGDRPEMRFGDNTKWMDHLYQACVAITKMGYKISFINHNWNPDSNCRRFQSNITDATVHDIDAVWDRNDIDSSVSIYKSMSAVIAMRGHAQMIPFGQRVPVVSLISHPKLEWFTEDVDMHDAGVNILDDNMSTILVDCIKYATTTEYRSRMDNGISKLGYIRETNHNTIRSIV